MNSPTARSRARSSISVSRGLLVTLLWQRGSECSCLCRRDRRVVFGTGVALNPGGHPALLAVDPDCRGRSCCAARRRSAARLSARWQISRRPPRKSSRERLLQIASVPAIRMVDNNEHVGSVRSRLSALNWVTADFTWPAGRAARLPVLMTPALTIGA